MIKLRYLILKLNFKIDLNKLIQIMNNEINLIEIKNRFKIKRETGIHSNLIDLIDLKYKHHQTVKITHTNKFHNEGSR